MSRIGTSIPVLICLFIGASTTVVAQQPIVEITKDCPSLRYLGRNAVFEIGIINRGDGAAYDVVVTDVIPEGIDFVRADNNGKREGSNIVWRVGTLGAGESRSLKATFRCNRIGTFRNSATLAYCARAAVDCGLEVKGIPAILLEVIDLEDPIEVGSNVAYVITVTNQGSAVGTNVRVVATLAAGQEYVSTEGEVRASVDGKVVTFAPIPTLAPKAKATLRVVVKGTAPGDARFKVSMTSDQFRTPVEETESTNIYQ